MMMVMAVIAMTILIIIRMLMVTKLVGTTCPPILPCSLLVQFFKISSTQLRELCSHGIKVLMIVVAVVMVAVMVMPACFACRLLLQL